MKSFRVCDEARHKSLKASRCHRKYENTSATEKSLISCSVEFLNGPNVQNITNWTFHETKKHDRKYEQMIMKPRPLMA